MNQKQKESFSYSLLAKALRFVDNRHLLRLVRESIYESGIDATGDNWKEIAREELGNIISRPSLFRKDEPKSKPYSNKPRRD